MSLIQQLRKRAADKNPIRVGVIGAGKFGSMFLSQAHRTPGFISSPWLICRRIAHVLRSPASVGRVTAIRPNRSRKLCVTAPP